MISLNILHITGAVITLIFISAVGVLSGRSVKNAKDFSSGGGKTGAVMVAGTIMGTLVGGSSTVATAQLAFTYGFSAIWFNLGAGLGCFVLAIFFAKRLRNSGKSTIQQMIESEYGSVAGVSSSVLGSIGIFLSIVAQLLSAVALISVIAPVGNTVSAIISCIIMGCYVIFGGMKGTGIIGIIKTTMLYICIAIGGVTALNLAGGFAGMTSALPVNQYFNLFARGFGVDGGAGLSLILGVLCTQTYIQSIIAGRDTKAAIKGAFLSAALIPPIGVGGVLIGIYMKINHPEMNAALAFPQFIVENMPHLLGGVFLAVLLIVTIGSGAGLALGIGSIFTNNIYLRISPNASDKSKLNVTRLTIVGVLICALIFTFGDMQTLILQWSFMSMGLRAAVVFFPMCCAFFMPKKIPSVFALLSIFAGPIFVLLGKVVFKISFDPLFLGMSASFVIMLCGYISGKFIKINNDRI